MKRLLICAILICVLLVCILLPCQAEEITEPTLTPESERVEVTPEIETLTQDERPHWQIVVEDGILPVVAVVVIGFLSIFVIIRPTLKAIKKAASLVTAAVGLFTSATDGVLKASESSSNTNERVAELEAKLAEGEAARLAAEKRFKRLLTVFASVFATNEELVRSGAAREMMKAVEEYVAEKE